MSKKRKKTIKKATQAIFVTLGILALIWIPQTVSSSERIRSHVSLFGFSLSVDSLERYAEEGVIDKELQPYTNSLDKKTLTQLRQILQKRIYIDRWSVYRMTRSPMGEEILKALGEIVASQPGSNSNGFYAVRGALIAAASKKEKDSFTLIDVIRQFPNEIWINTKRIKQIKNDLTSLIEYRDAAIAAIMKGNESETIGTDKIKTNSNRLPDLRQFGSLKFSQQTITIPSRRHNFPLNFKSSQEFKANLYVPLEIEKSAPIAIISPGFSSEPSAFDYLGEHLASHGIAVAIPEHIGSGENNKIAVLRGRKELVVNPIEFVERPLDIKYVLDELERLALSNPFYRKRLNLDEVGVIGHSLGGYTALALAGAKINTRKLRDRCPSKEIVLNISLLLQCRANELPSLPYQLKDERIKGVIAVSPISSAVFGSESLSKIKVPTMIVAGSKDIVAPVIQEQIYPFTWLKTPDKYLVLMNPADHFSNSGTAERSSSKPTLVAEIMGESSYSTKDYLKALSLAFIKAKICKKSEYIPYLSTDYARTISDKKINLNVILNLKIKQLEERTDNSQPKIITPSIAS